MRVYCLTSSFPRGRLDASGRFVAQWCELLESAGHDVEVFYWGHGPHDPTVGSPAHPVPYLPPGLPHLFDGSGAPDALERNGARHLEAIPAVAAMLARLAARPAPDLVVGHWLFPGGLVARLAGSLWRRSSLVVGHSAGVHLLRRLPPGPREIVTRWVASGPTTVSSHALAEHFGSFAPRVVPMGYEPLDVPAENGPGVLLYGRLEHIKGFDVVAPALRGREVHVVGDGSMRASLRVSLGDSAVFHGFGDRVVKTEVFPRCAVALFPSRWRGARHEGWPTSVLEAASAGVVPLVSAWPGAAEMVGDPDLQVVRDDDWPAAIERVLEARDSLREEGLKRAQRFTWEALRSVWLDVVEQAAR